MYITEDGDESSSKRKLIKKDRDFLLENFEPMTVCDTVMTSMFDENDMMIMRNIKGRRKRAKRFLEMCDKLPKEIFEMIFSSYLVKHLPSSKNVPNYEEMGKFLYKSSFNSKSFLMLCNAQPLKLQKCVDRSGENEKLDSTKPSSPS